MIDGEIDYKARFDDIVKDKSKLPKWLPVPVRDYYHSQLHALQGSKVPEGMRVILPAFTCDTYMEETWGKLMSHGKEVAVGYAEELRSIETIKYNLAWNNQNQNNKTKKHKDNALKHLQKAQQELIYMKRFAEDFCGLIGQCEQLIKLVRDANGSEVPIDNINANFMTTRESFKDSGKPAFTVRHLRKFCIDNKVDNYGEIIANTVNVIYGTEYEPNNIYNA